MAKSVLVSILLSAALLSAQPPRLLKDLNTTPKGPNVSDPFGDGVTLPILKGHLYFAAFHSDTGNELHRADLQTGRSELVKDIWPGQVGSAPTGFLVVGDLLYFTAEAPDTGREQWVTNGTPAGTRMIRDIRPGATGSNPVWHCTLGGKVFFQAETAAEGMELWVTDGTAQGTHLVRDIRPGRESSEPAYLTAFKGRLFFGAQGPAQGRELWTSDGTPGGTALLIDLLPGSASSWPGSPCQTLGTYKGKRFFVTSRAFYFQTRGKDHELWRSDGTAPGTTLVTAAFSNHVPFTDMIEYQGNLLISGEDDKGEVELWRSDGTPKGTVLVKDLHPGGRSSCPKDFVAFNGLIYFRADDGTGSFYGAPFWRTDGTAAGTVKVHDLPTTSTMSGGAGRHVEVLGGRILFLHQNELWATDGTPQGLSLVKDIMPGPVGSSPSHFTRDGKRLFFVATDPDNGRELWVSDGTAAGTRLFADPTPGKATGDLGLDRMVPVDRKLFFTTSGHNGVDLWCSDGTAKGTIQLTGVGSGKDKVRNCHNLTPFGAGLLFTAYTAQHGTELWKSDGTSAGTAMVKDITPNGSTTFPPYTAFHPVGNLVFFSALDPTMNAYALWRTDGTAAGTRQLPAAITLPEYTARWRGRLFFAGRGSLPTGWEPWVSDGTAAGTFMLKDICPGAGNGRFYFPLAAVKEVFFLAHSPTSGYELWKTRGTVSSTLSVHRADPTPPWLLGDRVIFSRTDARGTEPWVSDGTTAGTGLLRDIEPGSGSSLDQEGIQAMVLDRIMVFAAHDSARGRELWATDGTAAGTTLVKDILPGKEAGFGAFLHRLGDRACFSATGSSGSSAPQQIWQTDGTAAGTTAVKDLANQSGWYGPIFPGPKAGAGRFFFHSGHPQIHNDLWICDGTPTGTVPIGSFDAITKYDYLHPGIFTMATADGRFFFHADDRRSGLEIWYCDLGATSGFAGIGAGFETRLDTNDPVLGTKLTFRHTRSLPGIPGVILLALPGPPLALDPGFLYFDPNLVIGSLPFTANAAGAASATLPIPGYPGLLGAKLSGQAFTLPNLQNLGYSNGVSLNL